VAHAGRWHDRLLWGLLTAVAAGVLVYAGWTYFEPPPTLADFTLTERSGQSVSTRDLRGRVTIVGFTFTQCKTSCPKITQALAELQEKLRGAPIRLVAISVDPEHDTPEVLRQHADNWGADAERWWFLTGDRKVIDNLMETSFRVGRPIVQQDQPRGYDIGHSNRVVILDQQTRIRGSHLVVRPELTPEGKPSTELFAVDEEALERVKQDALELAYGKHLPLTKLPLVNAILNSASAMLLLAGFLLIRLRCVRSHMACMLAAVGVSAVFLSSYLYYHYHVGHTIYRGEGWQRPLYYTILFSHIALAIAVVPLVLRTAYLALRGRFIQHRRIARWTLPIWLYVSVTGVAVYVMLYVL
jgi:protein SCO1/2/putative membrane protein